MIKGKTLTECKVCGSALKTEFTNVIDPQTRDEFTISKCVKCKLGHTNPQPYDISIYYCDAYYGNRHSFMKSYCAQRRMRITKTITGYNTNTCILDIGCGDGSYLLAARKEGWNVTGIELNTRPAREAGIPVYESLEQVNEFAPFDCISFWHSLEHMTEPKSTLMKATKLLRPGGGIIISLPNFLGLQARFFKRKWFHLDVPRHLYHFNNNSIRILSKYIGCTIERQWHQELEYDLLGWSQSALNTVFRTKNIFFNLLTRRHNFYSSPLETVNCIMGAILTAISMPVMTIGTLSKRSGTIIFGLRLTK